MQFGSSPKRFSAAADNTSIADVPFVTTPSLSHCAMPIIGPPLTIFLTSCLSPPQYSIRSRYDVPIGTSRFFGVTIQSPSTVTIRSISGIPLTNALNIAAQVSALNTQQPTSAGSLPAGSSRPVSAYMS